MADIGLIRNRLRAELERARREAVGRRERVSAATRAYEQFLAETAVPAFRAIGNILRAERIACEVTTPSHGVRLAPGRGRDEGIELELDTSVDPPHPLLVTTETRGSRVIRTERLVKEGAEIADISEDDLIELVIAQLRPWLA